MNSPGQSIGAVLAFMRPLAAGCLLACLVAATAAAETRIALVVGNGNYNSVPSLDNPVPDAQLIARALTGVGFEVSLLIDTEQIQLNRAIARFGRELRSAGPDAIGLFYYAGHAVQSFGTNFLLPVDAELTDAADLSVVGVRAEAVLRQMFSARNKTNIVILDACRNNPFEAIPDMNDNGLAEMKAPTGTFLSYATAPGAVALDGLDGNSPFTKALAGQIPTPGVPIEQLFKAVRVEVLEKTYGLQTPWDTSSLTQDFQFVAAPILSPEEVAAKQLWDSIRITRDPVQVLLFLRAYPDSVSASEARAILNELVAEELNPPPEAGEETAAAPAPTPVNPEERERELIEVARRSASAEDYNEYLAEFPDGAFAELARFELNIIAEKAAEATEVAAAAAAPEPEVPPATPTAEEEPVRVTFSAPLGTGGEGIAEFSIEQLITGSPRFPPIEGLPEELWKGQKCSNCHQWTREALCTQAETYLADNATRALAKQHPYGGVFKKNLRVWAGGGCE